MNPNGASAGLKPRLLRLGVAVTLGLGVLGSLPVPAGAKGPPGFYFDYAWHGKRVTARTTIPVRWVEGRREPFFAYLAPTRVALERKTQPDRSILVGAVHFGSPTRSFGRVVVPARVSFVIPKVDPGRRYWVEICNAPCTKSIDRLGSALFVYANELEARVMREIHERDGRLDSLAFSLRERARTLRRHDARIGANDEIYSVRFDDAQSRLSDLEDEVRRLREGRSDRSWPPLLAGAGIGVAACWLLLITRGRGRRGWA